jgi:hypothetical protein
VATVHFKERGRKSIVANLPPSSEAFHYHCLRASRQIVIWLASCEQNMNPPAMEISGYQSTDVAHRFKIRWTSLSDFSDDLRLDTCGQCSSGCSRCKCGINKISCTFYCKCKADACMNQSKIQVSLFLFAHVCLLSYVSINRCVIIWQARKYLHSMTVKSI